MVLRLVGQIVLSAILMVPAAFITAYVVIGVVRDFPIMGGILRDFRDAFGETIMLGALNFFYFVLWMIALNWSRFRAYAKVANSVRHIAEGHLDQKVNVAAKNEVGELASSINRLLEQLQQAIEDERQAEQSKNELVTNVSHDLRTPLTSILGYLSLIDEDRYRDEVELRLYVQIAYEKAQRLHVLIQDLFEFTRLRHDAIPLQMKPINAVEIMSQMLVHYRLSLRKAGMAGHLHTAETELPLVADPDKLFRVFDNLFTNGIVYGQEGGKLDVYVRREGTDAVIEVVNYGPPIPAVDLPHIFERFYRVDRSRNEHTGGSGLGLAISKSIVERHGGSILAESGSSRTAFIVRLPLNRPPELQPRSVTK